MQTIKFSSGKKLLVSIVIIVIAIAVMILACFYESQAIQSNSALIIHTQEVIFRIAKARLLTEDIETKARNYVSLRDEASFKNFVQSLSIFNTDISFLQQFISDNPGQQLQIKKLTKMVDERKALVQEIISINQNKRAAASTAVSNFINTGERYLAEVKNIFNEMQMQENELLRIRKKNNEAALFAVNFIFYSTLIVLIALIGFIIRKIRFDFLQQKKVNEQLHYMETLINQSNDAIISTDEHFRIETWSRGAEKLYGYSFEEIKGKKAVDIVQSQLTREEKNKIKQELQQKGSWSGEVLQKNRNNEPLFVYGSMTRIKGEHNQTKGYLTVNNNITEQKNAEKEITYLAKMVAQSQDAIISINEKANITGWNKGAERLYGYSAAEAMGKNESFFLATDPQQTFAITDYIKDYPIGGYWSGERVHKKKSGETIHVLLSATILFSNKTQQKDFSILIIDITERKKMEAQLQQFNNELTLKVKEKTAELVEVFERVNDGFIALDKHWNFTYVNASAGEILGKASASLIGKNIWEEFPDSKEQTFYQAYLKAMQEQEALQFEDYFKELNRWYRNKIYPSQKGISIFIRDVTDEKNAQEELIRMNYRLRNLSAQIQNSREEERKNIAREIHDELGQTVTALKLDMSWLKRKISNENMDAQNRVAEMIEMLDLVMKTIRKIAQELRPSVLDDLGLGAAIEWQLKEFEKRTNINCVLNDELQEAGLNNAVKTTLFRICQESLTNIMRHSAATAVNCTLYRKANVATMIITDNGKGFDTNAKTKSFGLLGMRERALMVNGEINIESSPGKGTVVKVDIHL
jgi:PAS domain S-box-containing protein